MVGAMAGAAIGSVIPVVGTLVGGMLGGVIGGFFHEGGVVGSSSVPTQSFPVSTFVGAPRLHNGLKSDEFPAILQKGETVKKKGESSDQIIHNHYYQIKGDVLQEKALANKMLPLLEKAAVARIHG
jgi:phage tail tape-measure protein